MTETFKKRKKDTVSKDVVFDKLPPHHMEAEESVLSAILLDNDTLTDVASILKPADFYKPAHQILYESMTELFNKGEPVDLVTLMNHLKAKGKLEEVGGAANLARLLDTVPVTLNAEYHGRIIHDKASLRRLIEKSSEIIHRCYAEQGDASEIIDFAQTAIFNVADICVTGGCLLAIVGLLLEKEPAHA